MISKFATINNDTGLHARPASELATFAKKFESKIMLINGDKSANATSVIKILTLGAKKDTKLEVTADGADEATAIDEMVAYIEAIKE